MAQRHVTRKLSVLLIGLIVLNLLTKNGDIFYPAFFIISSIVLMAKWKRVGKKDIVVGLILGIISFNPVYGFCTVLGYIGAKSVFNKTEHHISVLPASMREVAFWGLLGAGFLSFINIVWMLSDTPVNISIHINAVIMGLNAGITEEILFRYLLFAICVCISGDEDLTKIQSVLCYFIMIIPHVLKHYSAFSAIVFWDFVLLCFFGLSFTYIQRKSCLLVAIGAHFVVVLLRFMMFGA